ncbi:MAG: Amine oxidase [Actinomycetia bacterium]|nr:Amine oxidase [Actinomycetes bacterium]
MDRRRVAVIGAGVSGLTAAYLLQRRYDVELYEAEPRLGGHAHTHEVVTADDRVVPVDSGFIVHNQVTYPNLLRLFGELGVETQASDMSMSVHCDECGLEYAGQRGFDGLFAQRRNLANPRYLRTLVQVKTFHREAHAFLAASGNDSVTLGQFLAARRFSPYFVRHFLVPLVAAVWSCPPETTFEYPARSLFSFFEHHGLLAIKGSPEWRTVVGGSRSYVERVGKELSVTSLANPVRSVRRVTGGVEVRDASDDLREYHAAVIATHSDQALALLPDPTAAEQRVLGAFDYSTNDTVLHTDRSLLPDDRRAYASWNYRLDSCSGAGAPVTLSYHMNRLQRLDEPTDYVVTLNGSERIADAEVVARMTYRHPVYTTRSVAAQEGMPALNTDRLAFAGAYQGWGFHEDGCASGVRAAASLGVTW